MNYTKESFTQELQRRFPGNEFEILEFSGAFQPIQYQCLKCGRIIKKSRANHLYENKSLCQHCYSTKNSKIRDWIINFFDNTVDFKLISWSQNTMDDITVYCNNCKRIFTKKPSNLYNRNPKTVCPYCGDNGAPILEEDYKKLMEQNGYIDYTILQYRTATQSVRFRHSCGYVFSQKGVNFLKSKGCPKCFGKQSKGELRIEQFLIAQKIEYITEYRIKEFKNYPYDFYLPQLNTLIEYQGQQHYFPVDHFGGNQSFQRQIQHDNLKKQYAEEHHYNLIIIPYTDYDKIETYLLPLLGSTTSLKNVASSEAKEKTSIS